MAGVTDVAVACVDSLSEVLVAVTANQYVVPLLRPATV
jgi:hypothetical protein